MWLRKYILRDDGSQCVQVLGRQAARQRCSGEPGIKLDAVAHVQTTGYQGQARACRLLSRRVRVTVPWRLRAVLLQKGRCLLFAVLPKVVLAGAHGRNGMSVEGGIGG